MMAAQLKFKQKGYFDSKTKRIQNDELTQYLHLAMLWCCAHSTVQRLTQFRGKSPMKRTLIRLKWDSGVLLSNVL